MAIEGNASPPVAGPKGLVSRGMEFWRRRSPAADDSGIDSDEEHRAANNMAFVNDLMQASESSSEEEGFRYGFRMPHVRVNHKGRTIDNGSHCSEESDDGLDHRYEGPARERKPYCSFHDNRSVEVDCEAKVERPSDDDVPGGSGRNSPSLLEVELTASDEDDDASVLELVIPMQQTTRYQRVPSNKPTKSQPTGVFTAAFWCCCRRG